MTLSTFLERLSTQADSIQFTDTLAVIDNYYAFTPTAFRNGKQTNDAGQNNGSCKIFAFGLLQQLTPEQTLACFGDYYRKDVLENPEGTDHQNIRQFMQYGWAGIVFTGEALARRQ